MEGTVLLLVRNSNYPYYLRNIEIFSLLGFSFLKNLNVIHMRITQIFLLSLEFESVTTVIMSKVLLGCNYSAS